ncbi:MAG: hypothetical protein HY321_02030 [Armatimonadetes bacterium]|nr:hypothetical protein [Armatimonadota bacterium]
MPKTRFEADTGAAIRQMKRTRMLGAPTETDGRKTDGTRFCRPDAPTGKGSKPPRTKRR